MNRNKLIEVVAEKTQLTKKVSESVINTVFNAIAESLVEGNKVNLVGFGVFEVRERAARKGRNPSTAEEIDIPASKAVAFKPGKALKDKVNQ